MKKNLIFGGILIVALVVVLGLLWNTNSGQKIAETTTQKKEDPGSLIEEQEAVPVTLKASQEEISFGSVPAGEQMVRKINITRNVKRPIKVLRFQFDPPFGVVDSGRMASTCLERETGECRLEISFSSPSSGEFAQTGWIDYIGLNGHRGRVAVALAAKAVGVGQPISLSINGDPQIQVDNCSRLKLSPVARGYQIVALPSAQKVDLRAKKGEAEFFSQPWCKGVATQKFDFPSGKKQLDIYMKPKTLARLVVEVKGEWGAVEQQFDVRKLENLDKKYRNDERGPN